MRSAGIIALSFLAGCAASPPRETTAGPGAPLVVGSGRGPSSADTPAPLDARPDGVAAWLRAERADTLVGNLGLASTPLAAVLAPVLANIDVGQAVDVVLTTTRETRSLFDLVPVIRFHARSTRALVALAERELDVREEGDRIYARPRGAAEDDHFACALSHADTVVCSTVDGVNRYGAWLSDVQPPPGPAARLVVYGAPAAQLLADDGELGALERDVENLTIDLDDRLGIRATLRLATRTSQLAGELAQAPGTGSTAFGLRGATGSVSFPGGGALPLWAASVTRTTPAGSSLATVAFAKPVAVGAWIDVERGRAALLAARQAPSRRAWLALAEALEPRYAVVGDVTLAELARTVRAIPGTTSRAARMAGPGSFVVERTEAPDAPGDPPRRTVMLGTRIADQTWLLVAPSEDLAAAIPKKLVVTPGTDVPHLLVRGEIPSSLGIGPRLRRELLAGPNADTFRRVEEELARPASVPFVVTSEPAGDGLVVTATMTGAPSAPWALLSGDASPTWLKTMAFALVLH